MAKKKRSAIVPAVVFSAVLAAGTSVIPACDYDVPEPQDMGPGMPFDVAAHFADLSLPPIGLDVAALDFATPKG